MTGTFIDSYERLAAAQKGHARGAPAYSVYVNRRIGRVLAAAAHRWGLTPDQATGISALHTLAALVILVVAPAELWTGIAVALLLVLGYAWDSSDGQLARLRGGGSLAGEWLDHFVDACKTASLHLCVLVALWWHTDARDTLWLVVPLAYCVVAVVTFFAMLLNDLLKGKQGVRSTHARGGGTALRSSILLPTDFGVLCLAFVLWGVTPLFLAVYTLLLSANAVFLAAAAVRWHREIRDLETVAP